MLGHNADDRYTSAPIKSITTNVMSWYDSAFEAKESVKVDDLID
jgi:hypothetical protein